MADDDSALSEARMPWARETHFGASSVEPIHPDIQSAFPGNLLAFHSFRADTCDLTIDVGAGPAAVRLQRGDRRTRWRLGDGYVLVPLGDTEGCEAIHGALQADSSLVRRVLNDATHGIPPEHVSQLADPYRNSGTLSALVRATLSGDVKEAIVASDAFVDAVGGRSWERHVAMSLLMLIGAYQGALGHGMRLLSVTTGHRRALLGAQLAAALRFMGEHDDADRMEEQTSVGGSQDHNRPSALVELVGKSAASRERELGLAKAEPLSGVDAGEGRLYEAGRALSDGQTVRAAWTLLRCWRRRQEPSWQAVMGEWLIAFGRPWRGLAYVEDALEAEPSWLGLHAVASSALAAIGHLEAARAQMEYAVDGAPGVFEALGRELPTDDSQLQLFAHEVLGEAFLNRCSSVPSYRRGAEALFCPSVSEVHDVLARVASGSPIFGAPEVT